MGVYPEGAAVNKGEPLFPRIDVKKELEELEKLTLAAAENKEKQSPKQETEKKDAEKNEYITIEDLRSWI